MNKRYKDELLANAIKYRLVYEYHYLRAPKKAAELCDIVHAGGKVLIYGDGGHSKEFAECLRSTKIVGVVADTTDDPNFIRAKFDVKVYAIKDIGDLEYDAVVLLGYWSEVKIDEFVSLSGVDKTKLFLPYKNAEMIDEAKKYFEIEYKKKSDKPTLCLLLTNDARDFVTVASQAVSEKFELVKIFVEGALRHYDNKFFEATYSAHGNFVGAMEMVRRIKPDVLVYFHTGPYENIKAHYLYAQLGGSCKIIYATTDIFFNGSFEIDAKRHSKWLNIGSKEIEYLEKMERVALQEADGVITNWGGDLLEKPLLKEAKSVFISNVFQEKESFTYKKKSLSAKIKLCHTGNVAFNGRKTIHKISTLDKVFESLLKQNFAVHLYHAQTSGKYKKPYDKLQKYQDFYWHDFIPTTKLPSEISGFHFGLNILNIDDNHLKIYNTLFGSLFQAKMITYLAAGLPVIVADEFRILRDFVLDNKIGISVKRDRIDGLMDIVQSLDYDSLKANVQSYQQKYLDERNDKRLAQYIEAVYKN